MKRSIIFPAYNEEKRIKQTLIDFLNYFDREVEILVVLNGCTDNTLGVVRGVQTMYPHLKYFDFKEKILKGGAIVEGFKRARGDVIAFVDADGATSPQELDKIITAAETSHGAIGSRWSKDSKVLNRESTMRRMGSKVFHFLVKILFQMPYHDTQCGAKVVKREPLMKIISNLKTRDMSFDVELLYLLHRQGYDLVEVPTVWVDQIGSAHLGNPLKFLKISLKMLWSVIWLRAKYLFR